MLYFLKYIIIYYLLICGSTLCSMYVCMYVHVCVATFYMYVHM